MHGAHQIRASAGNGAALARKQALRNDTENRANNGRPDVKHSLDSRPKRRPLAFEELESRLLLSADLVPALAPLADNALPPIPAEHRSLDAMGALPQIVMSQEAGGAHEVVFVDASLPDYERLVADVLRATGGERPVDVILLDPSRDGVAQISAVLATRSDLAAVHLVTHGGDGRLQLGDATLDAAALEGNRDAIAAWSRAFASDGDLLLYGCNVAATAQGEAFIDALARLTGADVAASEDATGAARLGGDWDLERTTGVIDEAMLPLADGAWDGLLATEKLDWDDPAVDWPAATTGSNNFTVGGGDVRITVADPFGRLNNGSPDDDTMNDQGGLPVTEQGLYISSTGFSAGESATVTLDFLHANGVSNVSFTIFDIDLGTFTDEVQATYTATGATSLSIANGPNNTVSGGDTVTGTVSTPSTDSTPGDGTSGQANATFTFTGSGITQIVLTYRNVGGASGQSITLHDISFDPTPAAANRTVAVNEDATYTFAAGDFGFSDVGGDTLQRVRITQLETAGSLRLNGVDVALNDEVTRAQIDSGLLTFTPVANANGAPYANFRFSVSDGASYSAADYQMRINVNPVNDAPVATNDSYAVNEDGTLNVGAAGVLANDTDIDGPALSAAVVAGPSNGSLTLNANGSFSYTPNANFNGTDSFTYRASDGSFLSNIATVTITVNAVNDAPVAVADAYAVAEDGTLNVPAAGVLANDSDIDGPALSAVLVGGPSNAATFALNANGSFSYTPTANFNGTDSFTYRASDGSLQSAVVTVTITVNPVNDAPVASGSATLAPVLEDPANPAGATVAALFAGNYSDATDGAGATAFSGIAITGNAATAAQGVWQYSPDGLAWTTIGTALSDASSITLPTTHLLRFLPAADFNGTPGALTVRLADGSAGAVAVATGVNLGGTIGGMGRWSAATVALGTSVTAVNDAPTFGALGNQTIAEDAGAQTVATFTTVAPGGGADEAGQTFSYTVTNDNNALFAVQPSIAANGTLTYTAAANAIGSATVTVFVSDSGGTVNGGVDTTGPRTFTIDVTPVADTPSVTGAATLEDTQTTSGLVITRNAADGAEVTHFKITGIVGGTLFLNDGVTTIANGTFITAAQGAAGLKFTPSANSVANGAFDVQASTAANDTGLGGSVVTATIAVTAVNDAPTFGALANQTVAEDAGAQTVAGFTTVAPGGGADEAGQTFSYTATNDNNTLFAVQPSIAANGTLTYTLAPNAFGAATVTAFVTDSGGTANFGVDITGPRTFTITATPVADTPSVTGATTLEDTQSTSGLVITRNPADGTEVTHFKITGIAGGTLFLSDGVTAIANGTFITAAEGAVGLKFTPSANSIANGTFDVQASTAANDTGLGGGVVTTTIAVTAVNDEPSFALAGNQAVLEDAGAQTIAAFATAAPGGGPDEAAQTFTYTVTNDNNALFAVQPSIAANGTLTFTPAANRHGTATVTVFVTDSGGVLNAGDDTAATQTFTITVTAVADAPNLSVTPAAGNEDTPIALSVAPALVDTDGSETLAVTVSGIPVGATLTDGASTFTASAGNQSVVITSWNLAALTVTPPVNSDVDFILSIAATATESSNGSTATTNANLAVTVDAVADAPTLTVNPAAGNEDAAIPLSVTTALVDTDGSETLALTVSAIPIGATLSDGTNAFTATAGNQSVAITGWNLAALTVTPPPNSDADFTLSVAATATEGANGSTATRTASLVVTVDAVADAPTLTVNPAAGNEDTAIVLWVVPALVDTDGSETHALTVSAIPLGATLTDGANTFTASPGNQSVVITGWNLAALTVTPPANSDVDFTLSVAATATESANGSTATTIANLAVTVDAVADAPNLTVNPAAGNEDTAIPLSIATALVDTDGSETLALGVSAIPVGATLSDGTNTFTASLGSQSVVITTWNLAALTVTPPANSDVDFALTVNATATETANGSTVITAQPLVVTVDAVADAPTLTVNPAIGNEDTAIALSVAPALVDTDGSETLALTVSAIPVGATLTDGANTFTASLGNQGVAITGWNLAALTVTPPANSDADFVLSIAATATEGANGAAATTNANIAVTVDAVADAPTLTINPAVGNEDTAIALSIAPALVDTDGSETLTLTVSAIPVGATLSDGANSFTASAGNQTVAITSWNLAQLRITPPANSDVDFILSVAATATEGANGSTATTNANLAVTVDAVADAPTLTVNPAAGNEDAAIPLSVTTALVDTDSSETLAVTVSGIPVGATLTDGANTFTASAGNQSVVVTAWNFAALTVTPPANSDVDFALTVSATATEGANGSTATTNANLAVTVDAVADAPTLTITPAVGNEDTAIALSVAPALVDTDGSETLALTVSAIPIGATLSDGTNAFTATAGNQSVVVKSWNLAALTITPPADSDVDFTLALSATTTEAANGGTATTNANLAVDVVPVNDPPVLGPVTLSIDPLQTVTMTGGNMSAIDVDNPAASLVFIVGSATNGNFELASAPGTAITSFTQAAVAAGQVRFVHTNAGFGPSFSIFVSDGALIAGPGVAVVSFRAPGAETPESKHEAPAAPRIVAEGTVIATGGGGLAQPAATEFLRGPLAASPAPAVTFAEAPAEAPVVLVRPGRAGGMLEQRGGGGPSAGFVEAERIATGLPKVDFMIPAVRHDDGLHEIDLAFGSARITGMALSVGAVWWAARAGGLLASLLASTPAWRHVDPLPVLGRDESEPDIDWDTPDKAPPEEDASEAKVFGETKAANDAG
jgi:VCBS repeat-containing protein